PSTEPLLGRWREREHVGPACAADQVDLTVFRTDREDHRFKRGVEVGADSGGHGDALARVRVQRFEPGARARVKLADILIDGLGFWAVLAKRQGDDKAA